MSSEERQLIRELRFEIDRLCSGLRRIKESDYPMTDSWHYERAHSSEFAALCLRRW